MIKQTRTVEVILMQDRLKKWFGIKMPSKVFFEDLDSTVERSDNMTDEEIKKLWDSLPLETAEIVVDDDSLRRAGIDPKKFKECHIVGTVDHPSHYNGETECIDAMIQTQGVEAVKAFCLCNAFKYLWRHRDKGGDEDIEKAKWYLEKYLELENMV